VADDNIILFFISYLKMITMYNKYKIYLMLKLKGFIQEDKCNWKWLSSNPNAIHLLEQNPNKIDWGCLSGNPNAIHLLEKIRE
jgi:hypothetical protein